MICPNLSNPDVAREFNELVEATSEKAAYAIWSLNNGNAIDKAPNGAQSKLFEDLLNYFDGDRTRAIKAKANTFGKPFMDWFGDWVGANAVYDEDGNRIDEVSKVVDNNGEPMIVYHGSPYSDIREFDKTKIGITSDPGVFGKGFYFTPLKGYAKTYGDSVYPCFLNIKNPTYSESESIVIGRTLDEITKDVEMSKQSMYNRQIKIGKSEEEAKTISERHGLKVQELNEQHKALLNKNFDGGIFLEQFNKSIKPTEQQIVVINANQIKSINNDGSFTDGNNIYHHKDLQTYYDYLKTLAKNSVIIKKDLSLKEFNQTYGTNLQYADAARSRFRYNQNETVFGVSTKNLNDRKINPQQFVDRSQVISYLSDKFGLGIQVISDEEYDDKFTSDKSSSCCVRGNFMYIRQDRLYTITNEQFFEEFLHPVIHELYKSNKELSDKLLNQAKEAFPDLCKQLKILYKDQGEDVINEEIITQVLAKYLNRETADNGFNNRNIIDYIKNFFQAIFDKFKDLFGDVDVRYVEEQDRILVNGADIRDVLNYEQLAQLINSRQAYFRSSMEDGQTRFNIRNTSITQQMYDIGVQLDTERQQYIRNILDQYKQNNPSATTQDESRVLVNARQQFDTSRSNQIIQQHQLTLAQAFGLTMNTKGFFESAETSQKKLMLEHFINSLQEATFKAYSLENINRSKYQQVGAVQSATSAANVLYNAIYEGDLTTLDNELARDYVRMFWMSPLIQSALEVVSNNSRDAKAAENALVDRMTREPVESRDSSIVDWFRNFWQQLNSLIHQIFGVHTFTDQQKEDILKGVDAAFMLSEDLEIANDTSRLLDRLDGDFSTSDLLSEKDKSVLSDIYQGTKTRLRSQQSRNAQDPKLIADLKSRLEIIDGKDQDSVEDVYEIIRDFTIFANQEIGETRHHIDHEFLSSPSMDSWNPQEINFIQQDLIGHYDSLLGTIYELFSDKNSAINKYNEYKVANDPNAFDVAHYISQLIRTLDSIKKDYNQNIVKPYVRKVLTDYVNEQDAITDKKTFIYNMERWFEQDSTYGDLSAGEVLIGMASRSKSPIVRIVEKMMSEAEFDTNREVLKKGNELVRMYNKIRPTGSQVSPYNWQKRFMELDREGLPTGYFTREINEGLFYKDKDEYEAKLRAEFGLTADQDGHTIFPEEEFTKDDSVYNKYNDKLDEWLDSRCNRRYTIDYYKARRRYLSPKTIQAQNRIQRQIDLILDKCRMESGLVDLSKLTLNERSQLNQYRRQKRDLGSHYIFTEGTDGILRVDQKTGDALKMADEISEWNKYITDKVKYKPDWTAFNKAISDMQTNGATQDEIDAFKRNNTVMRLTPEFYETLHKVVGKGATSKKLEQLKRRHTEIINALKEREGAGRHNLTKLGSGLTTDTSGWKELQRIEQEMADEKRRLKASGVTGTPGEIENLGFTDVAAMLYVPISDTDDSSFLFSLINQWKSAAVSNTNLNNVFNELFTYKDEKGKIRYLKAFQYLTPKDWIIKINDQEISCIESLPGSEYSELDESSPFVNESFIKNGKSIQVKKDVYKNEEFDKLTDDEKTFLKALTDTMDEANEKIPNKSLYRDGRLPQISGRTMAVLANTLRAKEWETALKYPFRKFGVKYSETDADVTTNMDLARRPDGSVVNNIPIRFVERLPNTAVQTTDVLGSVIAYFDMACNYSNKSQNLPTLELIKYAVDPSQAKSGNKMNDQYRKIENLLDQRYYGKETSFGFNSEEKITPSKQRTIQATKTVRNLAAVAMLGVNFTTIEVGYLDALCSMFADAMGGKYITAADMRKAFAYCIAHTGKMLANLGNPVVEDKLVAAMQFNQLSRSNSEIFSSTDKFKLDRFVHDHLLMGGYTLADYMINSMMLTATYNHYKLLTNPTTGNQQFMSKTDAINIFTSVGYTEKEAVKLWKKSKTTLWDAYEQKDGLFVRKDQYKDIITKKLEDQIAGRLRDRTAIYNGIIPMTEKAKMQQNVFGSFVTLMRNFYINTYWDKFKTGGDYVTEDGDHHISWTSEYKRDDLGLVNLETGEFEGAVFKDFCRGMYKLAANYKMAFRSGFMDKLTESQSYAVKRCLTELGTITALAFLMLWSVGFARSNDYDDDKDPVWLVNIAGLMPWTEEKFLTFDFDNADKKFFDFLRWKLALLSTRGFTERLTAWWPPTVLELFTSPSTAKSYLDDVCSIWDLSMDMFSQHGGDEIKTGGYKHMTRRTRDVLKLTSAFGFDNLVRQWHTDGIKSTFNYYRKLTPTSAIVPSQSEWNEKQGLGKHGGQNKESKKKKKKSSGFVY